MPGTQSPTASKRHRGVNAGTHRAMQARGRGVNTSTNAGAAQVDPDKPLTEMQRLFVHHWARGETPLSASIKAGYADGGTFAYRMIHMPNVLRAYHEEKLAYERASNMSRAKVIEGFQEAINMAILLGEPSTVVAGWREIGKMCGYYEPVTIKHEVSHSGKVLLERLDKLSDDQLMELIEKQAQAMALPMPVAEPVLEGEEPE